jgi:transposase
MEFKFFIGIDVSKDKLDVAVWCDSQWVFSGTLGNTAKEIAKLLRLLRKNFQLDVSNALFCMEHTGMYSKILLKVLQQHHSTTWIESALQIKKSLGIQRGKSDQVDAKRIAEYAFRYQDKLTPWQPPAVSIQKLRELLVVRERLVKSRKSLMVTLGDSKRFMERELYKIHHKASQGPIKALKKSIQQVEYQIREVLDSDENLKRLSSLIDSVEGVGLIITSHFIVTTNAFTSINNPRSFATYSGVAPFEHSSGTMRGKTRVSPLANKTTKTLLHLAAVVSITQKGELAEYYRRKVAEGKHKMSVLNAMRNKIIHRIFAVVNRGTPYEKKFAPMLA